MGKKPKLRESLAGEREGRRTTARVSHWERLMESSFRRIEGKRKKGCRRYGIRFVVGEGNPNRLQRRSSALHVGGGMRGHESGWFCNVGRGRGLSKEFLREKPSASPRGGKKKVKKGGPNYMLKHTLSRGKDKQGDLSLPAGMVPRDPASSCLLR